METTADKIFAHIKQHGKATRPDIERIYDLCEKTVDTAIRKLERLGYIKRAGTTPKEWHKRPAVIFVLSDAQADLKLVSDCRGRPRLTEAAPRRTYSFDALTAAMASPFAAALGLVAAPKGEPGRVYIHLTDSKDDEYAEAA
jgi:hypothetical protein